VIAVAGRLGERGQN